MQLRSAFQLEMLDRERLFSVGQPGESRKNAAFSGYSATPARDRQGEFNSRFRTDTDA